MSSLFFFELAYALQYDLQVLHLTKRFLNQEVGEPNEIKTFSIPLSIELPVTGLISNLWWWQFGQVMFIVVLVYLW